MDTVRAFVGCLVDLGATRRLVELSAALRKGLDAAGWKAAWVPPPNLHVTLKFLGTIDAGTVPAVSDALALLVKRHGPLRLGLRDLVAFPDRDAPRVLAVGVVEGHEALAALARDVDDACFELGFPREKKPFRGHVTLARVKHQAGALADVAAPRLDAGVGAAHDVALYRSDELRNGVEYHALSRHLLGEPRMAPDPTKQSEPERPGQRMSTRGR